VQLKAIIKQSVMCCLIAVESFEQIITEKERETGEK
jgi:hypothetical protein